MRSRGGRRETAPGYGGRNPFASQNETSRPSTSSASSASSASFQRQSNQSIKGSNSNPFYSGQTAIVNQTHFAQQAGASTAKVIANFNPFASAGTAPSGISKSSSFTPTEYSNRLNDSGFTQHSVSGLLSSNFSSTSGRSTINSPFSFGKSENQHISKIEVKNTANVSLQNLSEILSGPPLEISLDLGDFAHETAAKSTQESKSATGKVVQGGISNEKSDILNPFAGFAECPDKCEYEIINTSPFVVGRIPTRPPIRSSVTLP